MLRSQRLLFPAVVAFVLSSFAQAQAPGGAGVFGGGAAPAGPAASPFSTGQGSSAPVRLQSATPAQQSLPGAQQGQFGQSGAMQGALPGGGTDFQGGVLPGGARSAEPASAAGGARPALPPEPPSDFQRFVEQATGRMLPIYGISLFSAGRFEPVQATQVPDGYVVGPGDELIVQLYGAVDFSDRLVVDRDGRVLIPRVGPVKVAGLRFREVEGHLSRSIGEVYRNFRLSVSMGRLRSIEIYVLGQARSPGRKVVGSLSTLINALFETGGPSARGSMRAIELRRAGRVVTRIDLYDFIARGDSSADRPLEPGDIIYVPPVGPQVGLAGSVNEPAIYELSRVGGNIESVLALTGGLPTLAAPQKAQLERVDASRQPARFVQDIALDAAGLGTALRGGDIVTVFQISPQFANAVTLQGSVAAPMRYAYREGMRISDLVVNNNFLVPISYWLQLNSGAAIPGLDRPEVNLDYATIQRLDPVRLRTETIPFNLSKALMGHAQENLTLKPGDIVRVYSATEAGVDAFDSIALQASFVDGLRRFSWREGHRVTDVIPDLAWLREQVTRWVRTTGLVVALPGAQTGVPGQGVPGQGALAAGASLPPALAAQLAGGSPMQANALANQPGAAAAIGRSPTAQQPGAAAVLTGQAADVAAANVALLSAASFQELNLEYADIKRLDPQTMQVQLIPFNLGRALAGQESDNLPLRPGDRISLYTKQEVAVPIARRTRLVKVTGEVKVPGTYQVSAGETLPDIIRRAGGFTPDAYVYGTSLVRESTRIEQQRNLAQLLRTMEADLLSQANFASQNTAQADMQQAQAMLAFQRQTLERLRTIEVSGRIALDLDEKAAQPVLPSLDLEDGDSISIPTESDFVSVFGAVDINSTLLFKPNQRVREYLDRAGLRAFADLDNVVVLRADGTVRTMRTAQQRSSFFGWGGEGLLDQPVKPGDAILVPEQIDRRTGYVRFMVGAKDWTQLVYQFGLGAAAFKVLRQ